LAPDNQAKSCSCHPMMSVRGRRSHPPAYDRCVSHGPDATTSLAGLCRGPSNGASCCRPPSSTCYTLCPPWSRAIPSGPAPPLLKSTCSKEHSATCAQPKVLCPTCEKVHKVERCEGRGGTFRGISFALAARRNRHGSVRYDWSKPPTTQPATAEVPLHRSTTFPCCGVGYVAGSAKGFTLSEVVRAVWANGLDPNHECLAQVAVGWRWRGVMHDGLDSVARDQDDAGGVERPYRSSKSMRATRWRSGIARPHPMGSPGSARIRPPGRAGVDGHQPAKCSFSSTLCLALSHCREQPDR
jgi:hypothetical protein